MTTEDKRTRVTIYLNGERLQGGKLLVIPTGCKWDELLSKAAAKLGAIKPLTRVFVSNGAEATDVEEILSGDELYFSYGEDFIGDELYDYAGEEATAEQKIEKKRFLERLAKNVVGMASSAYDVSSKFVKQKSPGFVKVTLERVEDKVGALSTPLISKVVQVGTWADEKLDVAYASFNRISNDFLESPLAKTVNEKLVVPLKTNVVEPSQAFYRSSLESFQHLLEQSKGKKKQFSAEEFVAGLKSRLGQAWNEKLVEPAKAFYTAAMDRVQKNEAITSTMQSLDSLWKDTVVANFKAHVQAPAESFYQTALQSYVALSKSGDGKVTVEEFYAGMRVKLGSLWNEHLVTPAKYLYDQFTKHPIAPATTEEPAKPAETQEPQKPEH